MNEYFIMSNRDLKLEDNFVISFKLENFVQMDQLNLFKAELLEYLRKSLVNNRIQVNAEVIEADNGERKPYSISEKLQFLSEKYPAVAELKKRLGLDYNY